MSYWIVDGRQLTNEQYEELQRQKRLEKQRVQEEAARLRRQLGEAFAALKEHLRQNPNASQQITDERALDQQIYQNLRHNLERADEAPRCTAIKEDGTCCRSPKLKGSASRNEYIPGARPCTNRAARSAPRAKIARSCAV